MAGWKSERRSASTNMKTHGLKVKTLTKHTDHQTIIALMADDLDVVCLMYEVGGCRIG